MGFERSAHARARARAHTHAHTHGSFRGAHNRGATTVPPTPGPGTQFTAKVAN